MPQTYTGKCLCGDITYSMQANLANTGACHCDMCQHQNSGSPFHGAMCDSINWTGQNEPTWYQSSDYAERGFCATCGTVMAWRFSSMADQPVIATGTLNDKSDVKLKHHIFTDQASAYSPPHNNAPHKTKDETLAEWNM